MNHDRIEAMTLNNDLWLAKLTAKQIKARHCLSVSSEIVSKYHVCTFLNIEKMKFGVAILFLVGFVVIIDAKAVKELPNGGQILSPDGNYILGKFGI